MKIPRLINALLIISMISVISCRKDKNKPASEEKLPIKEVTLDKFTAVPGDIITLKSTFTLDKNSWDVKFGESNTVVNKVNDSIAVLRVPYLPVGNYSLDISQMGVADKKTITISSYTQVDDPEAIVTKINAEIAAAISIAQGSSDKKYVEVLQSLKQTFTSEYNKLSASEKKVVGYQLAVILKSKEVEMGKTMNIAGLGKIQANRTISVLNTSSNGDDIVAEALKFGQYTSAAVALLVAGGNVTAVFPDLASKVIGIGILASGVAVLVKALDQAEMVFTMISQHKAFNEVSISKFAFGRENDLSFSITSTYQSLSIADKITNNPFAKGVFENVDKLENTYTKLVSLANKVVSWFSNTPGLPPFDNHIPNQPISQTRATPAAQLSIENISDSRIKLAMNGEGNQVTIKPNDTDVNTEVAFTFDLVYKDDKLNISNRKTFNATYSGSREVKWVADMIPGDWVGHNGNVQVIGKLSANFTANFTSRIENGVTEILNPSLKRTWKIVHNGGEYIIVFQDLTDGHYEDYRIIKKGEMWFIKWYF